MGSGLKRNFLSILQDKLKKDFTRYEFVVLNVPILGGLKRFSDPYDLNKVIMLIFSAIALSYINKDQDI
jgi:hypothetical protein